MLTSWIGFIGHEFIWGRSQDYFSKNICRMEQRALRNVNNCLYTNVYSYLETSGGINYNPYLNVVKFLNTRVN